MRENKSFCCNKEINHGHSRPCQLTPSQKARPHRLLSGSHNRGSSACQSCYANKCHADRNLRRNTSRRAHLEGNNPVHTYPEWVPLSRSCTYPSLSAFLPHLSKRGTNSPHYRLHRRIRVVQKDSHRSSVHLDLHLNIELAHYLLQQIASWNHQRRFP